MIFFASRYISGESSYLLHLAKERREAEEAAEKEKMEIQFAAQGVEKAPGKDQFRFAIIYACRLL